MYTFTHLQELLGYPMASQLMHWIKRLGITPIRNKNNVRLYSEADYKRLYLEAKRGHSYQLASFSKAFAEAIRGTKDDSDKNRHKTD